MYDIQAEFATALWTTRNTARSLQPCDAELALLCGLLLLSPARSGITDRALVQAIRDKLMDALRLQVRHYQQFIR